MTIKEAIEQLSHCPDPENHRVCVVDPDTKKIVDVTAISAEDALKDGFHKQYIFKCATGVCESYKGFKWEYATSQQIIRNQLIKPQ